MNPILSIAIVNFNYGRYLEAAVRSVLDQQVEGVELVVVDGGSKDNSVEVIKKYADKLGWWVSEPDKGQSDAFNKAFAHCRGKYLTWLNADDIMPKGCLKKIVKELVRHPKCEWFTGNLFRFVDKLKEEVEKIGGGGERTVYPVVECAWGPNYLPGFLQGKGMPIAVYGPATIFTKRIFDAAGGMKLHQNFMMDTDLWMRFVMMGVKQRRINCFCWAFRMHVDSKTAEFGDHKLSPEQRTKFEAERKASHEATGYKPSKVLGRLWQLWRILDGSFVKGLWLKKMFKHVEVV
ncbi:MAG: glycosyltransferase [Kiritimatiellae bacterium]|nr:glycosyltransferase [Kiritimatiellia bacterium]